MRSRYRFLALCLLGGCGQGPSTTGQESSDSSQASGISQAEPKPEEIKTVETKPVNMPSAEVLGITEDALMGSIGWEYFKRKVGVALMHEGTKADPIPIDVDLLGAWEFRYDLDDPFPPFLHQFNGKVVKITGFMLPDIEFEEISQFHLVRSLWGCCFGAPPRVNEMVRAEVPAALRMDYTYNTLELIGTLEVVFAMEDGLIEDPYRLKVIALRELGFEDPLAPAEFDPDTDFGNLLPGSTEF